MKRPPAWIWEWIDEGCEFAHPLMGAAYDVARWDRKRGYRVLTVVMPLHFVVRLLWLLRNWMRRHARFALAGFRIHTRNTTDPWLEFHACATGDCDHYPASECLPAFVRAASLRELELLSEIRDLRRRLPDDGSA